MRPIQSRKHAAARQPRHHSTVLLAAITMVRSHIKETHREAARRRLADDEPRR